MTAITMSSLMPSMSTLRPIWTSPGEGGGVCSSLILCRGDWPGCAGGEAAGDLVCETGEGGPWSSWDRFSFFWGGSCSSEEFDFELERCAREALGSCIPSEGSDSDLRRVLYGMVSDVGGGYAV
jgi:hypothetical protein